jgi:dihydroorotate dehydrogenase (fumarate)
MREFEHPSLSHKIQGEWKMDLTTNYLGMTLKNPLVASSGPLQRDVDNIRRMEEAGVSAVVMYSLFEEQIVHEGRELEYYIGMGQHTFVEVQSYYPDFQTYNTGPDGYTEQIAKVKKAVGIPVIGSLNGVSTGGWVEYAKKIEQAGADALELNIYYVPTDANLDSNTLEERYVGLMRDIRAQVKIPVAVKLSPYFTALPNLAKRLVEAGANGLVLFNRFYQPDFDLEELEVSPNLMLSTSHELRLPLRWISLLYGRVEADMAASTGVHTAEDVLKVMMAGAKVAMMTSSLLKFGIDHTTSMLNGIRDWMEEREYESITQMQGSMSQKAVDQPAAFERVNYMQVLNSFGNGAGGLSSPGLGMQSVGLSSSDEREGFMSV